MENKELEPHQQRVIEEISELIEKINNLSSFLKTDLAASLPLVEQRALNRQLAYMALYADVLNERIERFSEANNG